MSRDIIRAHTLGLPTTEPRAPLELLESTEGTQDVDLDPVIEEAWYAELQRRRKLLDAGEMKLIPWEEVEAKIFGPDE